MTAREEIRAAARILLATVALSLVGGLVWGLLAPAEQFLVRGHGRGILLTGESSHQFDAVAIFLCIGAGVGVAAAIGAWMWRRMRGPILFAGLLIGTFTGAAAMRLLGEWIALLRFPRPEQLKVGQLVNVAPTLSVWPALGAAPLAASVAFLLFTSLSPHDDLAVVRGS